jgi:hypothetical protein
MDAIKKKMQAMKLEKDNAMDRALLCEQQARDANLRAEKVSILTIISFNRGSCEIHTRRSHIVKCPLIYSGPNGS